MTFDPVGPSLRRTAETLTFLDAFRAMSPFLESYWVQGGKTSGDIAGLLSGLELYRSGDPVPLDRATWDDFLNAIDTVAHGGTSST